MPVIHRITLDSFNPEAMVAAVQDSQLDHIQLDKGRFSGQLLHAELGASCLDRGRYNRQLGVRGPLCPDRITFGYFPRMSGSGSMLGHCLKQGDMVAFCEGSELSCQLPPYTDWVSFQIGRDQLTACGIELPASFQGLFDVTFDDRQQLLHKLSSAFSYLQAIEQCSGAVPDTGKGQTTIEDALLTTFATAASTNHREPCLGQSRRSRIVRQAEEYLQAHLQQQILMADLCSASQISLRGLERAFHEVYGMGPKQFLITIRLAGTRKDLLAMQPADTSVTTIALRWGFTHLGRFASVYKNTYGELPSQTLGD